jgi:hypothetical protein
MQILDSNVFSSTSSIAAIQTSTHRMQGLQFAQSQMYRHALGHSLRQLRRRRYRLRGSESQETAVNLADFISPNAPSY